MKTRAAWLAYLRAHRATRLMVRRPGLMANPAGGGEIVDLEAALELHVLGVVQHVQTGSAQVRLDVKARQGQVEVDFELGTRDRVVIQDRAWLVDQVENKVDAVGNTVYYEVTLK